MHIYNIFIFTIEGFIIGVLATLCIGMIFYDHDYAKEKFSTPQRITVVEKTGTPSTSKSQNNSKLRNKSTKSSPANKPQEVYIYKENSTSSKPQKIYVYKKESKGKHHTEDQSGSDLGDTHNDDANSGGDAQGAPIW